MYTVHLPYPFCTAENAVCRSRSTVHQSSHITTVLWTSKFTRVSSFLPMVTKGHFSWYAFFFLHLWKHLLFAGDGFVGAQSIKSAMLSLEHEAFSQMAPRFWRSIWLAALQMWHSLWEHFFASCLSCTRTALPRVNLHYSCLSRMRNTSKSDFGKFQHKRSATPRKIENEVFVVVFHEWQNPELLRGYPYFHNALWFSWFSGTNTVEC